MNGKNYRLKISELQDKIKFGECKVNIKTNGVTITLVKEKVERWTDLKPKQNLIGGKDHELKLNHEEKNPLAGMQDMMKEMY